MLLATCRTNLSRTHGKLVKSSCPQVNVNADTFSFIRSTILPLASAGGSDWLHCKMCSVDVFMNLTWFLYLANKVIPDKNGVIDIQNDMVNIHFMLGQRRRQLAYINPALSILQRKQDRSTPAQCFLNVGPASKTMDWLRLHTSNNDDPALGSC